MANMRDLGSTIKPVECGWRVMPTATTGTLTGKTIDREGFQSAVAIVNAAYQGATEGHFLTVTSKVQHSADGSNWVDLKTLPAFSVLTLSTVTDTYGAMIEEDLNLEGARKYVRTTLAWTTTISGVLGAAVEGMGVSATTILGGAYNLPV